MKRPSRKTRFFLGIGSAALVLGVLPFIFVLLPNPSPVKIPGIEGETVGTYVQMEDGLYKLYPFSAVPPEFPAEALSVEGKPQILIKFRQLDAISVYGVWNWQDNQPVPVRKETPGDNTLRMMPEQALAPGKYYISAARDGIYGGIDYFYLRVEE